MTRRTIAFGALAAAVAGCGGRTMDLGSNNAGAAPGSPNASPTASYGGFAGAEPCTVSPISGSDAGAALDAGASLVPLVGTWTGYIETLPATSGNLTLVFAQQADGSVTGSLTFGTAPPPPPPTSATELYPPGSGGPAPGTLWSPNLVPFPDPGFPYTAVNISFDGTRLQFGIVKDELWKAWCELQTSYAWNSGAQMCGCLPNFGGYTVLSTNDAGITTFVVTSTGVTETVNWALLQMCTGAYALDLCYCTAAGCSTNMETADSILDLRLAADELDGQITGALNVFLTQSP